MNSVLAVILIVLGGWLVLKISKTVLKVWIFAIFCLVGAALVGGLSIVTGRGVPDPVLWGAGAVGFGWTASLIRKRISRFITLGALAVATVIFFAKPAAPSPKPIAKAIIPAVPKKKNVKSSKNDNILRNIGQ